MQELDKETDRPKKGKAMRQRGSQHKALTRPTNKASILFPSTHPTLAC